MQKCEFAECSSEAAAVIIDARGQRPAMSQSLCEAHRGDFMREYLRSIHDPTQRPGLGRADVRFELELLVNAIGGDPHDLFLREASGTRRILLQPYYCEAWAIASLLQEIRSPRPLTHPAFVDTIRALGAHIQDVLIHDVVDDLIHAALRIIGSSGLVHVDVRASDGVAIALAAGAPILVAERLIPEWRRPL